jgi:hypothetical protein
VILLIHQLLLLGSIAALAAAGWRLAAVAVPSGLMRVLATVALAAGGAVISALALALASLGASPVALTVFAVAMWAAARRLVPRRPPSAWEQLVSWWGELSVAGRVARLALAAAAAGYGAWVLRYPALGIDALTYHLGLPVVWVHNGRPGSLVSVLDAWPVQNYPLSWEVLLAWVLGIARTFVPATLLAPAALLLLGVSVRAGLGECGVSARLSWLTAGTVMTLPIIVTQIPDPNNDVPELAWLACAAALVAGAAPLRGDVEDRERHGALLAPAVVAVGLCLGTKTTAAPLALLALVLGGWRCRDQLRRFAVPLAVAAVAGAFIGGLWYVRNLIDHGAPFWPLSTTPWGDPIPPGLRAVDASFLDNFHILYHRAGGYWTWLQGGLVLIAAALVSPLWARRRAKWGSLVVLAALLVWAVSPYTGTTSIIGLSVTRYLLPCVLAAAVTLALAARGGSGPAELLSAAALLGAFVVDLVHDVNLRFLLAPSGRSLLIAAAVGAALALAAELLSRALPPSAVRAWLARRTASTLATLVTAAAGLATLLVPVNGYLTAHARVGEYDAGLVRWMNSRPAFRDGSEPVLIGPIMVAVLTGNRLAHPVTTLVPNERCAVLARAARNAWVVIEVAPSVLGEDAHWIKCLGGERPAYSAGGYLVYAPAALAAA